VSPIQNQRVEELIRELRTTLVPRGSLDLIRLHLRNEGYVEGTNIRQAIDQLERRLLLGQNMCLEFNGLEKLGTILLLDSIDHGQRNKSSHQY